MILSQVDGHLFFLQLHGSFQAWLTPTQDMFVHPQGKSEENGDPTVSCGFQTHYLAHVIHGVAHEIEFFFCFFCFSGCVFSTWGGSC